jgi:hypothetical protein
VRDKLVDCRQQRDAKTMLRTGIGLDIGFVRLMIGPRVNSQSRTRYSDRLVVEVRFHTILSLYNAISYTSIQLLQQIERQGPGACVLIDEGFGYHDRARRMAQ